LGAFFDIFWHKKWGEPWNIMENEGIIIWKTVENDGKSWKNDNFGRFLGSERDQDTIL